MKASKGVDYVLNQETVEKRVRLDVETGKAVVELLNPSALGKMLLELIWAEQASTLRTNLKNQIYRLSNLLSLDKWVGEVSIG